MSKYKSGYSVAQRKPIIINSEDPRYKKLEKYKGRVGSKVIVDYSKNKPLSL
jgi:hypothetical protein